MKSKNVSRSWFIVGMLSAATFGAFANLPSTGSTEGSMAPLQDVSEIKAKRQADLSFDQDLKRLSAAQGRYRENLPLMKRSAKKVSSKKAIKPSPRIRAKVGQN